MAEYMLTMTYSFAWNNYKLQIKQEKKKPEGFWDWIKTARLSQGVKELEEWMDLQ